MQTMETRFTSQAKNFAIYAADKVARILKKNMTTLRQALSKIMVALEYVDMLNKEDLMVIN